MINVTLVCNDGDGMPRNLQCREYTTVEEFLNVNFDGDLDDYKITLRAENSPSRTANMSDELENGMRIVIAPKKVEGETTL